MSVGKSVRGCVGCGFVCGARVRVRRGLRLESVRGCVGMIRSRGKVVKGVGLRVGRGLGLGGG